MLELKEAVSVKATTSATANAMAAVTTGGPKAGPAAEAAPMSRSATADWPPQAELVMSALEAGQHARSNGSMAERRGMRRRPLRVKAALRLFSDAPQTPAWTLYARDVHARGLGFITPHRLPLGYGGILQLPAGDGSTVAVACTLLRCREAAPGWFEGSVYFNREQPHFAV